MKPIYIVDGMRSGTGIRDGLNGGYIDVESTGWSINLRNDIVSWKDRYKRLHSRGYDDTVAISKLDNEGMDIAKRISNESPNSEVRYFSDARMETFLI